MTASIVDLVERIQPQRRWRWKCACSCGIAFWAETKGTVVLAMNAHIRYAEGRHCASAPTPMTRSARG